MSRKSDPNGPGCLWVHSQPKPGCVEEYNEWYNTEHGPLRVKLDIFDNGYRYKSIDQDPPTYLATYDLKHVSRLEEPQYTMLADNRSPREEEVLDHKLNFLDRRVYTAISTRGQVEGPAPILQSVAFVIKDEHVDEMHRWYEEEHISDLMKIPGWLRTQRFRLFEGDNQRPGCTELLAVHEFEGKNGLDGEEHMFAKSRPWRNKVVALVESRKNQRYALFHEFSASDYKKPPELDTGKVTNGVHT